MNAYQLADCWHGASDSTRPVVFLVSTTDCVADLRGRLGWANYSYGFVLRALVPALERLGRWQLVPHPESSLVHAAARAAAEGYRPVHLAIAPAHAAYLTPAIPTVLFPFWEFPRIPDREFGFDTRQNWARIGGRAALILTACRLTADAFRRAGVTCPVEVVPVPLDPLDFTIPDWDPGYSWTLDCHHLAWGDEPEAVVPDPGAEVPPGDAVPLHRLHRVERVLKARYRRHVQPWLSPRAVQRVTRLKNVVMRRLDAPPRRIRSGPLTLSGLVYTSIFNIGDPRKNPRDLLGAFLLAFRDRPDVTLVLKLTSNPQTEAHEVEVVRKLYEGFGIAHRCRVVVLTEFLSEGQMRALMRATTYYVNTSQAEGACLPLQQALAAGRPGLAPAHSAMADYMDEEVGFVVASHPEPACWPHDPQHRCETTWHRLVWSDLHEHYLRSAALADSDRRGYDALAAAARRRMAEFAGLDVATAALKVALRHLDGVSYGAFAWNA